MTGHSILGRLRHSLVLVAAFVLALAAPAGNTIAQIDPYGLGSGSSAKAFLRNFGGHNRSEPECSWNATQSLDAVRCRAAAENGDVPSQNWLGSSLIRGEYIQGERSLQRDLVAGAKWLIIAESRGSKLRLLARFGYEISPAQIAEARRLASEWLEKHPRLKKFALWNWYDRKIIIALLYSYHTNTPTPRNRAEALKWYRQAAEQDYVASWNILLDAFYVGIELAKIDPKVADAVRYYSQRYDPAAWYYLSLAYGADEIVFEDDTEALKWSRKAAERGNIGAQIILGDRNGYGRGVDRDLLQTHLWLSIAASQFMRISENIKTDIISNDMEYYVKFIKLYFKVFAEQTEAIVEIVSKKMTPADASKAQRLAREWLEKHEARE